MITLFSICGINAGLSLAIVYLVVYGWIADGLDQLELSFMAIVSGFIFFGIITALDTWALTYYYREQVTEGKKALRTGYLFLSLIGGTIIMACLIDGLFHTFDSTIATVYGEAIGELVEQNGLSMTAEEVTSFIDLPFFLQNIAANSVGIILGVLLAILLARAVRNSVKEAASAQR